MLYSSCFIVHASQLTPYSSCVIAHVSYLKAQSSLLMQLKAHSSGVVAQATLHTGIQATCCIVNRKITHASNICMNADTVLSGIMQVHSTLDGNDASDFKFTVKFNSREHSVAVRQRPFLFEFLERVAQLFEVVVFTASQKVYAEQLLNILDPKR